MKDPRGGKREGSGRKRFNLQEAALNDIEVSFRKVAKENQTTAGRELARLAFTADSDRVRLKALELYYNVTVAKRNETTIEDKRTGPTICLPPTMEKPKKEEQQDEVRIH